MQSLCLLAWGGHAQNDYNSNTSKLKVDKSGNVRYIKFDAKDKTGEWTSPTSGNEFFKNVIGVQNENEFELKRIRNKEDGSYSELYKQYYNKIEVEGGIFILLFNQDKLTKATGHYIPTKGINPIPRVTPKDAANAYASYLQLPDTNTLRYNSALKVTEIEEISGNDTSYVTKLCYLIDLIGIEVDSGKTAYVDVQTGLILKTKANWNDLSYNGTFSTLYSGTKSAKTSLENSVYRLYDDSRGATIHTWDLNNTEYLQWATNRVEFTDNDNNWTSQEHSTNNDRMALDIHWALQEIYDYYYSEYGFESFDGANEPINAYAHAIFGGVKDNARYNLSSKSFFFGDGQTISYPLATLDVVTHEYAHGITHQNTGLNSLSIHDALAEGFSDIWAVIIEDNVAPEKDCWKIGEESIKVSGKDCMRNIETPESSTAYEPIADCYGDSRYNDGGSDAVYEKSGPLSHWFYLLSEGGSGTNDNGDYYKVYGLGMDYAADIVFEGHTDHMGSIYYYTDVREGMIDASEVSSLFGVNSFQALQVAEAWYAVGVGSAPTQVTLSGNSYICNSGTVITANNKPSGSTISWTTSSNLEVYSGGSTISPTFKPKYTSSIGDGWVQAHFTSNGKTSEGPIKEVVVNQPSTNDLDLALYTSGGTPVSYMCPNTHYHIYLNNSSGCSLSNYDWDIPSGWTQNYVYQNMISVYSGSTYGGMVEVYATTCCADNVKVITGYFGGGYCGSSYSLVLSPNPTSRETTISIEQDISDEEILKSASTETTFDENAEWDLEVYDNVQSLKLKKQKLKG